MGDLLSGISAVSGASSMPEAYQTMLLKKAMVSDATAAMGFVDMMPQAAPVSAASVVPKGQYIDVYA